MSGDVRERISPFSRVAGTGGKYKEIKDRSNGLPRANHEDSRGVAPRSQMIREVPGQSPLVPAHQDPARCFAPDENFRIVCSQTRSLLVSNSPGIDRCAAMFVVSLNRVPEWAALVLVQEETEVHG